MGTECKAGWNRSRFDVKQIVDRASQCIGEPYEITGTGFRFARFVIRERIAADSDKPGKMGHRHVHCFTLLANQVAHVAGRCC